MESEKNTGSGPLNACNFLLGKWTFCEYSSLVERYWTKPGSIQCTPRQAFGSTTGTVEYRAILYGSHVHGEYRQDAHPDKTVMSVLLQPTTAADLEMTIAASGTHRFGGTARISNGSMVIEGRAIPFFVGDYLQEAHIPLVPQAESSPISTDAVCDARIALHPLRPDLWLLVVYHVLNNPTGNIEPLVQYGQQVIAHCHSHQHPRNR